MTRVRWFKPKAIGYGATPASWQGWALTFGFALVIAGAIVVAIIAAMQHWPNRWLLQVVCLVVAAVAAVVLVAVARATTDGEWRLRI